MSSQISNGFTDNTQQHDKDTKINVEMDEIDGKRGDNARDRRSRNNLRVDGDRTPNRRSPNRSADISPRRDRRDIESAQKDAIPLLPTDIHRPPTAQPESDEESPDDAALFPPEQGHGIDDGFFTDTLEPRPVNRNNRGHDDDDSVHTTNGYVPPNGSVPKRSGSIPPKFPNALDYPTELPVDPQRLPSINVYQQKKTLAQGMMDLALLSANANQLRYVLESYQRHPYYYFSIVFISLSLLFQVLVGIGLILNSRYNVADKKEICKADKINNYTIIGIFLVTVINVFVSAFGVAEPASVPST